jgi:hypothetical protein
MEITPTSGTGEQCQNGSEAHCRRYPADRSTAPVAFRAHAIIHPIMLIRNCDGA